MRLNEWLTRIKNALYYKIDYKIGVHFPYNPVRIWSMRQLGYSVGNQVYIASDVTITQNFVYNRGMLEIGDRVSIAPHVIITLISHANASKIRSAVSVRRGGEW